MLNNYYTRLVFAHKIISYSDAYNYHHIEIYAYSHLQLGNAWQITPDYAGIL
jgi:hypothetical protein